MKAKLLQKRPKTYVVIVDTGEEVVAGLLRFANEKKLRSAHLTAIGAFQNVTLGFFEPGKRRYKKIPINDQVELLTLVGNLARDSDGHPRLHAHVVVGKWDGTVLGGHLMRASVRPTMEIVITASSQKLRRRMHDEVGAALLELSE
jgi:predicted DNA-binding protein with PD1-like motif